MKNEIEVIDGIKGEWRTVTKASEVTVGQRVRYEDDGIVGISGYTKPKFIQSKNANGYCSTFDGVRDMSGTDFLFCKHHWRNIQAFFPLPVRSKRKVAKVKIEIMGMYFQNVFYIQNFNPLFSVVMTSRKTAIKSARRFCKAIGYECEIMKEGK